MYLEKPKGLTIWNVVELKNAAIHDSIFEIKFIWAALHENPVSYKSEKCKVNLRVNLFSPVDQQDACNPAVMLQVEYYTWQAGHHMPVGTAI